MCQRYKKVAISGFLILIICLIGSILFTACGDDPEAVKPGSISVSGVSHGKITYDTSKTYQNNDEVTFTFKPDSGYVFKLNSLYINNKLIEGTFEKYSVKLTPAGIMIRCTFERITEEIKIGNIENGKLNVSTISAAEGDIVTLYHNPAPGFLYKLGDIIVTDRDGNNVAISEENTFVMPAKAVTITGSYTSKPTYSVSLIKPTNGSVTLSTDKAKVGTIVNITATPDADFQIDYINSKLIQYDENGTIKETTLDSLSFQMPENHVKVNVIFKGIIRPYNIELANIQNGDIKLFQQQITKGNVVNFKITPNKGYKLVENSVKYIDSEKNETAITNYDPKNEKYYFIFTERSDLQISASFVPIDYKINIAPNILNGVVTINSADNIAHYNDKISLNLLNDQGAEFNTGSLYYRIANDNKNHQINGTSFNMPSSNITVSATFEKADLLITIIQNDLGTIKIKNNTTNTSKLGNNVSITVTPNKGAEFVKNSIKVNGKAIIGTSFTMPAENVTITAEFKLKDYAIKTSSNYFTFEATVNGKKQSYANFGDTVKINVIANAGYYFNNGTLKVNGILADTNEFVMPAEDVVLDGEFGLNIYHIKDATTNPVYPYTFVSSSVKIGDKLEYKSDYPAGIKLAFIASGKTFENGSVVTSDMLKDAKGNELSIVFTSIDNRTIGSKGYNLNHYKTGTYRATWQIHQILSSNFADIGVKKINQYTHFIIDIKLKANNKVDATVYFKEDVMTWAKIEDVEGTKGELFNDNKGLNVPYTCELDISKIQDSIIKIEGYVPKAPIESVRYVTFEVKANFTNCELLAK